MTTKKPISVGDKVTFKFGAYAGLVFEVVDVNFGEYPIVIKPLVSIHDVETLSVQRMHLRTLQEDTK